MALDPQSLVLSALYRGRRDEAAALAAGAVSLTIWEAAALGREDRVSQLADADASLLNAFAPDGHTPLGLAAFFGHAATVRLLLARGGDPSIASRNEMKVQPLHAAVAGRSDEAVRALVEAGADVNARQQIGYTPLMGAASAGREDLVPFLLARGADPSLTNEEGATAATIAREHGHDALAATLGSGPAFQHDSKSDTSSK